MDCLQCEILALFVNQLSLRTRERLMRLSNPHPLSSIEENTHVHDQWVGKELKRRRSNMLNVWLQICC